MSLVQTPQRLELPVSLQEQLLKFRKRVWSIKMIEAACGALFGLVAAYLALFTLDRLVDTPAWGRVGLFAAVLAGCAWVPMAAHKWIWGHRRLDQLARLLGRSYPRVGDQLLGIIELVRSDSEQARSRTLCEAAIEHVAQDAARRDFSNAVPNPRHRLWMVLASVPGAVAAAVLLLYPAAAANAWSRLLSPWGEVPRYTFAAIEPLPESIVVPHGEAFSVEARLAATTESRPAEGRAWFDPESPSVATLTDDHYRFNLPAQIDARPLELRIGDWRQEVRIDPRLRPELTGMTASVQLPEYLGQPDVDTKDVRGGAITLVNGSQARFIATAGRDLSSAMIDGAPQAPAGASVSSPLVAVDGTRTLRFEWRDEFGLSGREPFLLTITGRDDEAPSLICEGLQRHRVVLDSEQLDFQVKARDDFGVKCVGIEWAGTDDPTIRRPARGEKILGAGGHDRELLELAGAFSAKSLGIEPQPIALRVFAEDYLPGRSRVYSPVYVLYVLSPEQHAIWLTEQLSKWHRHSLEVRDRELQLFETNKQLRDMTAEELDQPETRRKIEQQSAAEKANGRRLSNLVASGEELVRQASRNPEFGVGHLEKWAEMLQILKDISANRMPSVADLLKEAAQSPQAAGNAPSNKAPMAGQNRGGADGRQGKNEKSPDRPPAAVPKVVDQESSQQPKPKESEEESPDAKKPSNPRLTLPVTTLMGNGSSKKKPSPAGEKMEEAVAKQQDLLAEFEKVAEELNRVLANLEGSTLVKRLKAAARMQLNIAGRVGDQLDKTFGRPRSTFDEKVLSVLDEMSTQEAKGSHDVSLIMDDMEAYFERRRLVKFKSVLDDMREQDVVGALRQLGDDLPKENGLSIAQAEFWSDTLDRWAEDLVDPACCGSCPGCKSKGSLPPSIVLEVLQILEAEVNLRDETRVAEQARPAVSVDEHREEAGRLSQVQRELQERIEKVIIRIRELPDGESDFAKELRLLAQVSVVMDETVQILARPETGAPAIGAETEAIELLLQSKRINPKAGGGGGSSPGGGGGGDTQDSALTLLGTGANDKEVREDRGISQSTGESGASLPEEFRAGLDEYFNRLERPASGE